MHIRTLCLTVSISCSSVLTTAQEIPDRLRQYVFYTYLSVEHVWHGTAHREDDSTAAQYRLVTRVHHNVRDIFVERIEYVSKDTGGVVESPENARLTSFWRLNEEDFRGVETPCDPKTQIEVEKWKTYGSLVLKAGSNRYLLDFRDLPLRDFKVIDDTDNILDTPVDY